MSTRLLLLRISFLAAAFSLVVPRPASAAHVLFVNDDGSDMSIADALRADGHDVTTVDHDFSAGLNPSLHPDLSGYDCVVWSATADDSGLLHSDGTAFTNLTDYVSNGGSVLVTGYGAVGFGDTRLVAFLGGDSGQSFTGTPQQVADLDTNLTTGVVDIRGVFPSSFGRFGYEAINGLGDDTVLIVAAQTDTTAAQWSIRTIGSGHIAWIAGIEDSDVEWSTTSGGGSAAFNGALRNFVAASTGTGTEPGAPRVTFTSPFTALEGASFMVTAHVTDAEGDSVTFSWDLDGDGEFGEQPNVETVTIPEGLTDGPGAYLANIEASDGVHNTFRSRSIAIQNVSPTTSGHPPTTAAIDQHVRYMLGVLDPAGARDPLTFNLVSGPSTAIVTPEGLFDWTTTEADITAAGTSRAIVVSVDDGDGGTLTISWTMTVIPDHAPSDPLMLYPSTDTALLIAGMHFAVGNSSDLDGDPITYTFEVASNVDFTSDRQTSEPLPATATGITEWSPDESALHYGRWYWRVSASDGHVATSPMTVGFLLVPDPTMFPDVGIPDAGPPDGGAVVSSPRGCSCAIGGGHESFGPFAAISALIGLVVARRRRRALR